MDLKQTTKTALVVSIVWITIFITFAVVYGRHLVLHSGAYYPAAAMATHLDKVDIDTCTEGSVCVCLFFALCS